MGVLWISGHHTLSVPQQQNFLKPRASALAGFVITFQSALQNCEIDYCAGLAQALEQGKGAPSFFVEFHTLIGGDFSFSMHPQEEGSANYLEITI